MDQEEVFVEVLQRKETFSDDVKTSYNKTQNLHLSKGVSP